MSVNEEIEANLLDRLRVLAPDGWLRMVLNCEAQVDSSLGLVLNGKQFAVTTTSDGPSREQMSFDDDLSDCIRALHSAQSSGPGAEPWTVLDVELDVDGGHRVDFGYGAPKRINGVRDHESFGRFKTYVEDHRAELEELAQRVR